ncbi:MAG: hypothetical protein A2X02_01135 [Bacteroidetes bacterium GWF2_29_10]|nr:MAG: hypothetical protein A2X02_01135 [Bacteroidetes bacterium GWF2_29_10]
MLTKEEKKDRLKAWILTLSIHAGLIILFFLIIIKTPIPPYPEGGGGGGLEVNFGTGDEGWGEFQPEGTSENIENISLENSNPNNLVQEENYITQNFEDAPELNSNELQETKDAKMPEISKPIIKKVITDPKAENTESQKVNKEALYVGGKKNNSVNEGTEGGVGDQGVNTGALYTKNKGNGGGTGTGEGTGSGSGIGSGSGSGMGSGSGNGIGDGHGDGKGVSFSLKGRKSILLPKPSYNVNEQGKVVVEITVDKKGNVIKAVPGVRGTTTSSQALLKFALEAAYKAKFNSDVNAAEYQKGIITYNFIIVN